MDSHIQSEIGQNTEEIQRFSGFQGKILRKKYRYRNTNINGLNHTIN